MKLSPYKKYIVLSILFFLPVMFLLFLYPAKHNYTTLDVVKTQVVELDGFQSKTPVVLEGHLTVLAFLGNKPMDKLVETLNLKELIYDKFKGFKNFQIVFVLETGSEAEGQKLRTEVATYESLEHLHLVYGNQEQISALYKSLKTTLNLDSTLATQHVFIVDKNKDQRGRLDDREDREIEKNEPTYPLLSYNTIKVAEIKNKMSEDLRILFTEYRQKRKGNFNSTSRRENDIKQ
ncbi:hypothetical protein IA57_03070 [Mangrovimonas yunxiaonensis]|uniref:Membrane or secreted protein n=1 Tax=Mangrovimonas yunxiaonensis TaxID=1197477 RepID=A0A084TMD4_9FLAO|nr:hypothetical protein [Mangrovimonas yunxiaonensis]KFB01870.1 hypothetical protein IA57_03070 [Mangrovimonas yunxiaonensis]